MSLTPERQRQIIAKESAWVDDGFGQLDLTAFPALNELPPEKGRDDGRFAKDWRDTPFNASASALRAFVSDPDAETLERVGNEIGHSGFRDEVRQRKGESACARFKAACPDYLPTDANYEMIASTLAFNALPASQQEGQTDEIVADLIDGGFSTVPNLTATYHALNEEGLLEVPAGTARNLSATERLRVSRLAQAGRVDEAIGEYLRAALDDEEPTIEMVNSPEYVDVCNAAVFAVFEEITLDYSPSPEHQSYLMRYAGSRPLTLPLLQQAWRSCQATEQRYQRGELLSQFQRPEETPPPSARDIDAMDDASIENLYHRSLRAYADSFRRTPGVLA